MVSKLHPWNIIYVYQNIFKFRWGLQHREIVQRKKCVSSVDSFAKWCEYAFRIFTVTEKNRFLLFQKKRTQKTQPTPNSNPIIITHFDFKNSICSCALKQKVSRLFSGAIYSIAIENKCGERNLYWVPIFLLSFTAKIRSYESVTFNALQESKE